MSQDDPGVAESILHALLSEGSYIFRRDNGEWVLMVDNGTELTEAQLEHVRSLVPTSGEPAT